MLTNAPKPVPTQATRPDPRAAGTARAALCGALLLLLAACASAPKPTQVDGAIQASPQLNPSVSQRPSPLLLRIYELKSATAFNGSDFMSLYQKDQTELAADLVAREDLTIAPGETRAISKTLAPETRFIGVVAAYRNLERAIWRSTAAVQPGKQQRLVIRADALAVSVTVSP